MEKKNIIKEKTFEFAKEIVYLYKNLADNKEFVLSKQILRSGTSIGANVREAEHAQSKADFIHKLSIALNRNDCMWRKFFSNAKQRKKHHITC